MKKLLERLRNWLIVKLGGVTRENAESILEYWDKDVHKLAILTEKNASLEQTNNSLIGENNRLKMELDRNPPAWKTLGGVETLYPRTIRAERVIHRYPDEAVDIVGITKDSLSKEVLKAAKQAISYQFQNGFEGNSRVIATLRVLTGPGVAE